MKNGTGSKLIISVMLMLTMIMMSACTTFDSFKNTFIDGTDNSENVIRIGVFEPQTGRYSDAGLSEIKGIELANSIYNTVDGYKVELVKVDTQSTTNAAETVIQGLIKMEPVAIIGSCGEATSLIASKYVDKAGIPTITPSATNPLITQNYRYYFRASLTGSQIGEGIAEYAYTYLDSNHIGIVTAANDTAATALLDGFNKKMKKYKEMSRVVMQETVDLDDSNVNDIIKEIKENSVDTLFIPLGTEAMDAFFNAIETAGLTHMSFIGTKAWGNADFIEMMTKHPNINLAFPYQSVLNGNNATITEEAERFLIQYANKYGDNDTPTENAALGYDAYLLLINAIHNADSLKGADIRTAIYNLSNVKCATGTFNFDNRGNTVRGVNISTIKNGKIVSLHVTKAIAEIGEIEEIE